MQLPNTITPDAPRVETESPAVAPENVTPPAVETPTPEASKETLFAGKYKSVEELESAYKHSESKIGEVTAKLKEFDAPEDYAVEIEMPAETAADIKALAKEAGMSQSQLNKMLSALHTKNLVAQQKAEAQLSTVEKEIGTEKLRLLDNFVEQTYPASIAKAIKQEYRSNKDVAEQFYQTRENSLRKVLPTSGFASQPDERAVDKEMRELAIKSQTDPDAYRKLGELAKMRVQRNASRQV